MIVGLVAANMLQIERGFPLAMVLRSLCTDNLGFGRVKAHE